MTTTAKLISLLRDLGYENIDQLKPIQLNVVTKEHWSRRFVDFMLINVNKERNFVSCEDLKRFNQMKLDGRVVMDTEKRRILLNDQDSNNDDHDIAQWSESRFKAAQERLQQLKRLEESLIRINRQYPAKEQASIRNHTFVRKKCDSAKKRLNEKLMDVDIEAKRICGRMKNVCGQLQRLVRNPSFVRLFVDNAQHRGLDRIRRMIIKCQADFEHDSEDYGFDATRTTTEMELQFRLFFHEQLIEEMLLADAKARMNRIGELPGVSMRIETTDMQQKIRDKKENLAPTIEQTVVRLANAETQIRMFKIFGIHVHELEKRKAVAAEWLPQISKALKMLLNWLAVLHLVYSVKHEHVNQSWLQPASRMIKELRNRMECIDQLRVLLGKMAKKSNPAGRSRNVATNGFNVAERLEVVNHVNTIMDLVKKHDQAVTVHANAKTTMSNMDEMMDTYEKHLNAANQHMIKLMKIFAKKCKSDDDH